MVEQRTPNPFVGGSSPSRPARKNTMKAIETVKTFLNEVKSEMKKVSWSSRQELVSSAWIVIVSVLVFTVILGFFDFSFSKIIHVILRQGS